jgi:hypothetical protein
MIQIELWASISIVGGMPVTLLAIVVARSTNVGAYEYIVAFMVYSLRLYHIFN